MTGPTRLRARSVALALSGWLLAACSPADPSPTRLLPAPHAAGVVSTKLEAALPTLDAVSSKSPKGGVDVRETRTGGDATRRSPIRFVTDTTTTREAGPAVLRDNAVLLHRWHVSGYLVSMA